MVPKTQFPLPGLMFLLAALLLTPTLAMAQNNLLQQGLGIL